MHALHLKLLREVRRLWPQILAIALVMAAGVATLVIGVGTYQSLAQTRNAYYESHRFADIFATVTRAPRSLLPQIAAIDGVLEVDARIAKHALMDLETMAAPASALLVSIPRQGDVALNRLYLRSGRLPEIGNTFEAVASEVFADANDIREGSRLKLVINGAQREVTITGIALSPDYIYAMAPGEVMPNEGGFGVLWVPERNLAAAYDLAGAFNSLSIKLLPGASEAAAIEQLDRLLEPYGGQGAYGRERQTSHAYLDTELTQLRAMSQVLPPIFLLVAAFLVNMTLTRLIALEREQIGLLKALGYSSWAIAWHYIEFVLLIAILGTVIGFALGIWAGNQLALLYARFYSFPILIFSRDPALYVIAAFVTVAAAVVGAVRAASTAASLPPAVAMLPPAPPHYKRFLKADIRRLIPEPRQTSVMVARHLLHWPWRTVGGVLGAASSVAILVGSLWTVGAMEFMIDYTFNKSDRQDATLSFVAPKPLSALYEVARLPGILVAEPFRMVGAEIGNGHVTRRLAISGRLPETRLTRLLDASFATVAVPDSGLLITRPLAEVLNVGRGETVEVKLLEGRRNTALLPVAGVIEGYLGMAAYMDINALGTLMGESDLISGAAVSIDPTSQDKLFTLLKESPSLGHLSLRSAALERFRETMAQNLFVMVGVLVALAGVIAFGIVYNFARISLSEQGREMASLRVLGFRKGEVAGLLLAEIGVVVLLAQPLGWLLGYGLAIAMVKGFSSELFSMPLVVGPEVYAYSSLVVVASALIAGLVVVRRVDRLDMIAVLKTRE
jgi:putative ABC transport system permease protein